MVTERFIRRTLKRIARQRVAVLLQPGDVWVIELAVSDTEDGVAEALRTCHLRGWVEVLHDAVPKGQLGPDGQLPNRIAGMAPVYRVTESGWAQIRRTHDWLIATFAVSLAGLIAALVALLK